MGALWFQDHKWPPSKSELESYLITSRQKSGMNSHTGLSCNWALIPLVTLIERYLFCEVACFQQLITREWKDFFLLSKIKTLHTMTCWLPTESVSWNSNPLWNMRYLAVMIANFCYLLDLTMRQIKKNVPRVGRTIWWWLILAQTDIVFWREKFDILLTLPLLLVGAYTYSVVIVSDAATTAVAMCYWLGTQVRLASYIIQCFQETTLPLPPYFI